MSSGRVTQCVRPLEVNKEEKTLMHKGSGRIWRYGRTLEGLHTAGTTVIHVLLSNKRCQFLSQHMLFKHISSSS